jgi:hypothetical protein
MRNVQKCLLGAVATLAAACDPSAGTAPARPRATDEMPTERSATAAPVATRAAATLATIELARGGAVTFLDVGGGEVAIAERAPRGAAFVALPMVQRFDATPLELYAALAPRGARVPDALTRDHRLRAAHAPRALGELAAGATVAGDLTDPGYGPEECDAFIGVWNKKWKDAFAGVTKYREAAYLTSIASPFTFYPGASVYYGTNTNSKTYLGACNGASMGDLVLEVHRRISGEWVEVLEVEIESYEKYTFYSGVPASYRGRTYGAGGVVLSHYGVGAAWTLSPPIGIAPPLGFSP